MRNGCFVCVCLAVLCLFLLNSCKADSGEPVVPGTTAVPAAGTELSVTSAETAETGTATETEEAASVPYTLAHTVVDLSEQLPKYINEDGYYRYNGALSYANAYMRDGALYIYSTRNNDETLNPRIYRFLPDGTLDETVYTVPMIDGMVPFYAFRLHDGNMVVFCTWEGDFYKDRSHREQFYAFYITDENGMVLVSEQYDDEYNQRTIAEQILINETEDGTVNILIYAYSDTAKMLTYSYDCVSGELTAGRIVYMSTAATFINVQNSRYIGENQYLDFPSRYDAMIFDLNTGLFQKKNLRISSENEHMTLMMGEDSEIYMADAYAMYQYRDNLSPVKVADWMKTGIYVDEVHDAIWVIDDHTMYLAQSEERDDGTVENSLYYITTETVPEYEGRQVIQIDAYGEWAWLNEAIFRFNAENTEYNINVTLINSLDQSTADMNEKLQERMLYNAHPDIIFTTTAISFDDYFDKNVFLDVAPYFADDLLGCITECASWGGKLYELPMSFWFSSFVSLEGTVDGALTWEAFYEIVDSLADGELLTTDSDAVERIYDNGIMDFFDRQAKTASYDSTAFRSMVRYTAAMGDLIDENAGYLTGQSDGTWGYTNTTLPARIAGGGVKLVNVDMTRLDRLVSLKLLFGDDGFDWCGYPSNDGGGAYIHPMLRMLVLSDTDVQAGCLAFLEYLLSDEWQCADSLMYLPVTKRAVRKQLTDSRYWYMNADDYDAIGDPNAVLQAPSMNLGRGDPVGYINLTPDYASAEPLDTDAYTDTFTYTDPATGETTVYTSTAYWEIVLTDAEIDEFLDFLDNCHMKSGTDTTVQTIVEEELSYWENGVRTLEETTKIIQSRVWIYLNE
ncbi:MAG: hypothetical protein IJ449_06370 [Clostridia bacterium]|nr:hypothetical protein [Clostridia bacterium]